MRPHLVWGFGAGFLAGQALAHFGIPASPSVLGVVATLAGSVAMLAVWLFCSYAD